MTAMRALPLLLTVLTFAACAAPHRLPEPPSEAELLAENTTYRRRFQGLQREMEWRNDGVRRLDYGEDGTVLLRRWELQGLRGKEYLQVWFTYENTTPYELRSARVVVTIKDPDGKVVSTRWMEMDTPGFGFVPGDTYTATLRVPTHDAHWTPGWTWSIGCIARARGSEQWLLASTRRAF
jgi:hypothetical protein